METLRRACLIAAITWVGLHLFLAAAYADDHQSLPVLLTAMCLAVVATAVALRPLMSSRWSSPMPRTTWSLAAGPAATAMLVVPFLDEQHITGYANWPMGGMCVVIGALVIMHGRLPATVSALCLVAVNTWWVTAVGVGPVATLFLAVPPVLWLIAGIGVDSVLRRSAAAADEFRRRAAESLSAIHVARAITEAEQHRLAELEDAALPLLRVIADGLAPDSALVREAENLSHGLRDDLRTRSLMTTDVRRMVSAARARGITVVLSADPIYGTEEPDYLARQVLVALLERLPAGARISFRLTQDPLAITAAVSAAEPAILAYLRDHAAPEGWATQIVDTVDGLVIRFVVPPTGD